MRPNLFLIKSEKETTVIEVAILEVLLAECEVVKVVQLREFSRYSKSMHYKYQEEQFVRGKALGTG